MKFDGQGIRRFFLTLTLKWIFVSCFSFRCYAWHQTFNYVQRSSYESVGNRSNLPIISQMKHLLWFESDAIYGAREQLLIIRSNPKNGSIETFVYRWPVDPITMEECLQEWHSREKCYNDIVHVRIRSDHRTMDVYSTYAHRPMVRLFDLEKMKFLDENHLVRDPNPPIDSENSYAMVNFHSKIITAGYQGDYIPTIRATDGKTLLYALRPNSYFIDGFSYDDKAVFGVIESSERSETTRISRLVMACANRTEIVRKATLNCSTVQFDSSRAFVFHILTSLVDPIRTKNGSTLLFTTFTTINSSITASALCLFILNEQFYDVFTGPSANRKVSRYNQDMNELILNCNQSISSTIDRDMVESEREFLSYNANPLLIETMSADTFTSIDVIEYEIDFYCFLIGTSDGRLISAFANRTFQTNVFEELKLPTAIRSISHRKTNSTSYLLIVTDQFGFVAIGLTLCENRFCFHCWPNRCLIRKIFPPQPIVERSCSFNDHSRLIEFNQTSRELVNSSISLDDFSISRSPNEQSNNKLLFYIVAPMSFIVFILSVSIIVLLTKSSPAEKSTSNESKSAPIQSNAPTVSNRISSPVVQRTAEPIVRPISYPIQNISTSFSMPKVPLISTSHPHPLSVRRLYKSYV